MGGATLLLFFIPPAGPPVTQFVGPFGWSYFFTGPPVSPAVTSGRGGTPLILGGPGPLGPLVPLNVGGIALGIGRGIASGWPLAT